MPCDGFLKRWSLMWRASWVLSLVACAGCAAYTPATLTTAHPAHPEAVAAPELPASTTLAYRPADIPSLQPAAAHVRTRHLTVWSKRRADGCGGGKGHRRRASQ